jgi:hypothetical protein
MPPFFSPACACSRIRMYSSDHSGNPLQHGQLEAVWTAIRGNSVFQDWIAPAIIMTYFDRAAGASRLEMICSRRHLNLMRISESA